MRKPSIPLFPWSSLATYSCRGHLVLRVYWPLPLSPAKPKNETSRALALVAVCVLAAYSRSRSERKDGQVISEMWLQTRNVEDVYA